MKEYLLPQEQPKPNWVSTLFMLYMFPLLRLGQSQSLEADNIGDLRFEQKTLTLYGKLQNHYNGNNLKMALFSTFKNRILIIQVLVIVVGLVKLIVPLLIREIIEYIQRDNGSIQEGLLLILYMIIVRIVTLFGNTHVSLLIDYVGYDFTTVIQMELFQKMLRVSFQSNIKFNQGQVINFMQVDSTKLQNAAYQIANVIQFPIQLVIGCYLAFNFIGISFMGGIGAVVLSGSINTVLARLYTSYQAHVMSSKDERTKETNEVFSQIKFIKINALENYFKARLIKLRDIELVWLRKTWLVFATQIFFNWLCPSLIINATFCIYIMLGNDLNPSTTFALIGLFAILEGPILSIPEAVNSIIQTVISLNRCAAFLQTEEVSSKYLNQTEDSINGAAVKIVDGNFYWNETVSTLRNKVSDVSSLVLKDIQMTINRGQFITIVGDVGAGKSSIIQMLLNEMLPQGESKATLNGSIAYVGQKCWIQNSTVKDNILFGNKYDQYRYQAVLRYSCLNEDIKILLQGDKTMIGEKGINLSGGQKARISLARALYQDSDIYLLDDLISAVDGHVGQYIIQQCLNEYLKDKTRILVTHAIVNCQYSDYIYLIDQGSVVEQGTFTEIMKQPRFSQLFDQFKHKHEDDTQDEDEQLKNEELIKLQKKQSSHNPNSTEVEDDLIITEDREVGTISNDVLKSFYEVNGGSNPFLIIAAIQLIGISIFTFKNIWLAIWSEADDETADNWYYIKVYLILSVFEALFAFLRNLGLSHQNIKSSKQIHSNMIEIMHASQCSFFERIPQGRIMNRFTKDLDVIDTEVYPNFSYFYIISTMVLSDVFLAIYASTWLLIIPIAIFMITSVKIQRYYMKASRELYRIEAITKSPILSYFSEAINGVTVIRSFNKQNNFIYEQAARQDTNRKVFLAKVQTQIWFTLYLGMASYVVNISAICFCIFYGQMHPANAGLILVYGAFLDQDIAETVQSLSQIENGLISFERCQAFAKVPHEVDKSKDVIKNWPSIGTIKFNDYSVRYRANLPFALKGLSAQIDSNMKIGVVGRTGAGKSTLTMALLRLIENATGSIEIDGVNIGDVSLQQLRQSITMIMQDATIFRGSLRDNLDPTTQLQDNEITTIANHCNLGQLINRDGLGTMLSEAGSNLSAGERQLVCIARAVLRKSKIVLIDEATANIDVDTEKQIQETIQREFMNCTVITIAHRLNTILHCDKIMVIDKGAVAEYGDTSELLERKDSLFFQIYTDAQKQLKKQQ